MNKPKQVKMEVGTGGLFPTHVQMERKLTSVTGTGTIAYSVVLENKWAQMEPLHVSTKIIIELLLKLVILF